MDLTREICAQRCRRKGINPEATNQDTGEPNWKQFEEEVDNWVGDILGTGEDKTKEQTK